MTNTLRYQVKNGGELVAAFGYHDQAVAYVDHRVEITGLHYRNYTISDTRETTEARCIKIDIDRARKILESCQHRLEKLNG